MKLQNYKEIALSRLTDRHRSDEAFLAILDTLIEVKDNRQKQYIELAETFLDIDKSSGKNLDVIGRLIGEERTLVNFIDRAYFGFLGARLSESYDVGYWYSLYKNKYGTLRILTDSEYRRVLKARVLKNSSNNGRNSLLEVLNILLDNNSAIVIEGADNTAIGVRIRDEDGLASYYLSKYKSDNNLIPIPLGRRLSILHILPTYFTSLTYPYLFEEGVSTSFEIDEDSVLRNIVNETGIDVEKIGTSYQIEEAMRRAPLLLYPDPTNTTGNGAIGNEGAVIEGVNSLFVIESATIGLPIATTNLDSENITTSYLIDNATQLNPLISSTMQEEIVVTSYLIDNAQFTT